MYDIRRSYSIILLHVRGEESRRRTLGYRNARVTVLEIPPTEPMPGNKPSLVVVLAAHRLYNLGWINPTTVEFR